MGLGGKRRGAGQPPLPREEYRGHVLRVRVNEGEREAIEAAAKAAEKTVSAYLRDLGVAGQPA